ncbi:MAG: hypothetical protein QOF34_1099, partial [Sphingomonadales bacterium]|nr:hypothetical protein [Sphingomonadales bacterium]
EGLDKGARQSTGHAATIIGPPRLRKR